MTNPNLITNIEGKPKSGKTHLALTFPDPMIYFSFDIGLEPVLNKFKDKVVDVKTYPIPIVDSTKPKPYAQSIWSSFTKDYASAIDSTNYQTAVIDTGTILYMLARHARQEELKQPYMLPRDYGEIYARLIALVQRPRVGGMNLVITHWLRDRYVDDKNTGTSELDGWKGTIDYVDLSLRIRREIRDVMVDGKKARKNIIVTSIEDNRYEKDLNGMEFDDVTYEDLISLIVGG